MGSEARWRHLTGQALPYKGPIIRKVPACSVTLSGQGPNRHTRLAVQAELQRQHSVGVHTETRVKRARVKRRRKWPNQKNPRIAL